MKIEITRTDAINLLLALDWEGDAENLECLEELKTENPECYKTLNKLIALSEQDNEN